MSVEVRTYAAIIAANAVEQVIDTITAADDEQITILETGYFFTGNGSIVEFQRNEQVGDIDSRLAPDVDHRAVRNILLERGDYFEMRGSDISAAPNFAGVLVVMNRIKK